MNKKKKETRGRPYGSYSIKQMPDGSQKRIDVFSYRKLLKKKHLVESKKDKPVVYIKELTIYLK